MLMAGLTKRLWLGGACCVLLLTSIACNRFGDPAGGMAATRIAGAAAAKLPDCPGTKLASLTVTSKPDDQVLWSLRATRPEPVHPYYVLGQPVNGYEMTGSWDVAYEARDVYIEAEFEGGVSVFSHVRYSDVKDKQLVINGRTATLKELNNQIYCGLASK
jgi:hypothetical protein